MKKLTILLLLFSSLAIHAHSNITDLSKSEYEEIAKEHGLYFLLENHQSNGFKDSIGPLQPGVSCEILSTTNILGTSAFECGYNDIGLPNPATFMLMDLLCAERDDDLNVIRRFRKEKKEFMECIRI